MQAFESLDESSDIKDKWQLCYRELGNDGVPVRSAGAAGTTVDGYPVLLVQQTTPCQGQCPRVSDMHLPIGPKDEQAVSKRGNMPTCGSRIDRASHLIQYKGLSPR